MSPAGAASERHGVGGAAALALLHGSDQRAVQVEPVATLDVTGGCVAADLGEGWPERVPAGGVRCATVDDRTVGGVMATQ